MWTVDILIKGLHYAIGYVVGTLLWKREKSNNSTVPGVCCDLKSDRLHENSYILQNVTTGLLDC